MKDFNADFYGIAATVVPVFYLAHAVLRSITGGLLIWAENGFLLALGISFCVCLPMVGEAAALAALYGRQATWEAGWTWISLGWAMGTFMVAAILALWKICRAAQSPGNPLEPVTNQVTTAPDNRRPSATCPDTDIVLTSSNPT